MNGLPNWKEGLLLESRQSSGVFSLRSIQSVCLTDTRGGGRSQNNSVIGLEKDKGFGGKV